MSYTQHELYKEWAIHNMSYTQSEIHIILIIDKTQSHREWVIEWVTHRMSYKMSYTQNGLHTKWVKHKMNYTQAGLYTDQLAHRKCYTEKLVTYKTIHPQSELHTELV